MTGPSLNLAGALSLKLSKEHASSVLTNHQMAVYLFELYRDKEYGGRRVRVLKPSPDNSDLKRVKEALIKNGIIQAQPEIASGVFRYLARPNFESEQIICGTDPFAYVSHLSAMVHYGFTDRLPKIIFASTWDAPRWREEARKHMEKQLGNHYLEYLACSLPRLRHIKLKAISKQQVSIYASNSIGSFVLVRDRDFRVSSIGRTFLDMLRRPDLCNGMSHVLDVFEEHAKRHLTLIINELDQHGSKIECARAGYILEEICGINNDNRIDAWQAHVQRGGSRKLDPLRDYEPDFSDRWSISLNVIR